MSDPSHTFPIDSITNCNRITSKKDKSLFQFNVLMKSSKHNSLHSAPIQSNDNKLTRN